METEAPTGAIVNGQTLADRVEAALSNCTCGAHDVSADWAAFRQCFDYLVDYAQAQGRTQGAENDND